MSYETIAAVAQQGGLVYFFLLFLAVLVYALRPRAKATFDQAAHIPLRED
ncbi:cbb3-type cytochrome oxidase subunit 3 [Mongoliimonas terrestris]|nr:cbb3-type cytochrome c oxidase subunit 3 [Mongoliimonas terrestris]